MSEYIGQGTISFLFDFVNGSEARLEIDATFLFFVSCVCFQWCVLSPSVAVPVFIEVV